MAPEDCCNWQIGMCRRLPKVPTLHKSCVPGKLFINWLLLGLQLWEQDSRLWVYRGCHPTQNTGCHPLPLPFPHPQHPIVHQVRTFYFLYLSVGGPIAIPTVPAVGQTHCVTLGLLNLQSIFSAASVKILLKWCCKDVSHLLLPQSLGVLSDLLVSPIPTLLQPCTFHPYPGTALVLSFEPTAFPLRLLIPYLLIFQDSAPRDPGELSPEHTSLLALSTPAGSHQICHLFLPLEKFLEDGALYISLHTLNI